MIKKLQALKAKKGFTLVELIVVIAIIGVLAAILIPTLSGVIESSRKRSAESTCQSIQNLAKTFASTVMSKKGEVCTAASTVDMDEGTLSGSITGQTMKDYIQRQIPELAATNSSTKRTANITLTNGQVTKVVYTEGSFESTWDAATGGLGETKSCCSRCYRCNGYRVSKQARRMKAKLHRLKNGALKYLREYHTVKRECNHGLADTITIVCMLGVSAVTILFTIIG